MYTYVTSCVRIQMSFYNTGNVTMDFMMKT